MGVKIVLWYCRRAKIPKKKRNFYWKYWIFHVHYLSLGYAIRPRYFFRLYSQENIQWKFFWFCPLTLLTIFWSKEVKITQNSAEKYKRIAIPIMKRDRQNWIDVTRVFKFWYGCWKYSCSRYSKAKALKVQKYFIDIYLPQGISCTIS